MEQQGAVARQISAANADDENSQAEGTSEGAVGYSRPTPENINLQQQQNNNSNAAQVNNPHYENIYESIEQYAANNDIVGNAAAGVAIAVAPADNNNAQVAQVINLQPQQQQQAPQQPPVVSGNRTNNSNINYRNDLYDRTNNFAYDVPRSVRSSLGMRRNNLQLDFNTNRMRYNGVQNSVHAPSRQRSFDDTESYHYYNFNNSNTGYGSSRYENIYEQIRDEPIYRNSSNGAANSRLYGRLDVIGHGIGRIERHLSSSCGNIDHYNLGGHYAVLGHSHFGTVGHIRLNASNANGISQPKDNAGVKASNSSFFSCLGGENSQSMSNIYRAASNSNANSFMPNTLRTNTTSGNTPSTSSTNTNTTTSNRCTGAIPKSKLNKTQSQNTTTTSTTTSQQSTKSSNNQKSSSSPEHSSTLNRISKSSLQWLLVNKWLPLWIGQGPDCKIIDFNFMFSRNCDGCGASSGASVSNDQSVSHPQDLVRFNGRAEMHTRRDPSGRPLRSTLSRLRESECPTLRREENNYENVHVQFQNGFEFGRSRDNCNYERSNLIQRSRARSESPTFSQRVTCNQQQRQYSDPFKSYELNTENNTFKPRTTKQIRRITDGGSGGINIRKSRLDEPGPSGMQQQNSSRMMNKMKTEEQNNRNGSCESNCDDDTTKADATEDDQNNDTQCFEADETERHDDE